MADLTDDQWVDEVVAVVGGLIDKTLTPAEADVRLTAATKSWPTRTLSNAELALRVSRFMARLNGLLLTNGPPPLTMGDLNTFAYDTANGALYGPKTAMGWGLPVSLVGPPGPSVELQKSATYIQYRVKGATTWINLVPLADLKGADGQNISLQATATHIQWRLGAGAWADLVALSMLKGADGQEVGLQRTATHVQWRLGAGAWTNLITLTDLTGPVGPAPNVTAQIAMIAHGGVASVTRSGPDTAPVLTFNIPAPLDGVDAKQVEFNKSATHIQWRRIGDAAWLDLVALSDLMVKGDKGDAFEFDAKPADLAARAVYDAEPEGFTVLVMDTGMVYARIGATAGVWSDGFPFGQTQNAILEALSQLNATAGVLVQTGPDTFAKRAIGVGTGASLPDRDAADTRYRQIGAVVPLADITGLVAALDEKADAGAVLAALSGKQNALGFAPEDASKKGAANGYAGLGADGKVPSGQLPEPPTVPVKASAADLRVGTNDAKFATAKSVADAMATVVVTPVVGAAGLDFSTFINAEISVTANLTLGPPSGGFARKTGEIDIVQDATGGRTIAFHANYIVPANFALQATANGRTSIPYRYQADGKVRLYNPSKWVA